MTDIDAYESDLYVVLGQFQIFIINKVEGFVDRKIPYNGELLSKWLFLLNETVS